MLNSFFLLNSFFFVYTLVILFVCGAAAVMALTASTVVRSRASVPQALMFMFYVADLAVIFQNEWFLQNEAFDASTYYDIPDAGWRILFSAAFIWCIWSILLDAAGSEKPFAQALAPTALFAVASAATLLLPYGAIRQWLFYSMRQLFLMAGVVHTYRQELKAKGQAQARLAERRGVAVAALVFLAAILIEDSIVILAIPPQDVSSGIMLYLSERNFSENVAVVVLAIGSIRQSVDAIRAR